MLTCTRCGVTFPSGCAHYCGTGPLLSNIPLPVPGPLASADVPMYSRNAMEDIVRRVREEAVPPDVNLSVIMADLGAILMALGVEDYARPYSAHDVVHRDVIPTIRRLWDEVNRGQALLAEQLEYRLPEPEPGTP